MTDQNAFISKLLDRLGHEEAELKKLGMVNHANGIRIAIVAVLKVRDEKPPQMPDIPRAGLS